MKVPRKLFWRILLVVYLAAVAYVCFAGQGSLPKFTDWPFSIPADKCVHFVLFLPWPILACLSFIEISPRATLGRNDRSVVISSPSSVISSPSHVISSEVEKSPKSVVLLLIITLIGMALAGTTEWIQGLLPYRSKDAWDFIADCLGLLAGALLFAVVYLFLRRSRTR